MNADAEGLGARIGRSAARNLYWVYLRFEFAFVLAVEGITRLAMRLDPRLYDEAARVKAIDDGHRAHGHGKYAVFVVYCSEPLPGFTISAIDAFNRGGFDVVAVSNGDLHPKAKAYLQENCRLLLYRENIGRDFGGYKDAISTVFRRFPDIRRLIIANDSVFYFPEGLDALVAGLDGPGDFIGASEVFDHHYHVGSYLISFGRRVLESDRFREFWTRYKPIGTRRWAVFKGEGALSATLVAAGFKPTVLFPAEALRPFLKVESADAFERLVAFLSLRSRRRYRPSFAAAIDALDAGRKPDTASTLLQPILDQNQIHTGGFLFRRFLGLPILKRDMVFRKVCTMDEALGALSDLDPETLSEVRDDLMRRGSADDLGLWGRARFRHGAL